MYGSVESLREHDIALRSCLPLIVSLSVGQTDDDSLPNSRSLSEIKVSGAMMEIESAHKIYRVTHHVCQNLQ